MVAGSGSSVAGWLALVASDGTDVRSANEIVPFGLALGAETALLLQSSDHAADLLELLEPLVDVHATLNVWGGGGFYWGSLRHGYGLMLALTGRRVEAQRQLEQAAADQQTAGAVGFAQRSRAALVELQAR